MFVLNCMCLEHPLQVEFEAPLWSLISTATPIVETFLREGENVEYKCLARILDIDSEPATANPYGPVKYASLKVQGLVFPGQNGNLTPPLEYNDDHILIGGKQSSGILALDFSPLPPDKPLPITLPKDRSKVGPGLFQENYLLCW